MMADTVEVEGNNGGGSGRKRMRRITPPTWALAMAKELEQVWTELVKVWEATYDEARAAYHQSRARNAHARAYYHALTYALLRAYVSLAVKASGFLALSLSTVILLGGYVQSLEKHDFFCIMAITMIQAAGIFQDWETNLQRQNLLGFVEISIIVGGTFAGRLTPLFVVVGVLLWPFTMVLFLCVDLLYFLGPLACAAISSWRIAKLSHGHYKDDGTDSFVDMMATLNIFYSLIIFQGTMFLVLLLPIFIYRRVVASIIHSLEQLSEEWGEDAIRRYLSHICRKDTESIKGMDLIKYAAELLDSESQEDYLYGARILSAFVNRGQDVSWVLLHSRHRIQRLIDSLMISSSRCRLDEACVQSQYYAVIGSLDDKKEIRELAVTIMADVAAHIDDLSKYPGAMRCISSLLQHQEETTQTYRNTKSKQVPDDPPRHDQPLIGPLTKREHCCQEKRMQRVITKEEEQRMNLLRDQKMRMVIREHQHRHQKKEGGRVTSNKLVQQGLTILERLASNSNENRRIICSAPGLLPKITAPVYSATLIEDIKTKAWADIVTRCLKVLYQLVRAPDGRHQIFPNVQALGNLKNILELGNDEADHQELQLVAMEILTELALDLSINLSKEIKEVLVKKQLMLFLFPNGDDDESSVVAGRAMVSLSTNSESNSALIMGKEDITGRYLTEILDDKNNITRRTIAAQIMANLCAHCNDVDNDMKEILPKVLREIMTTKRKSQEREESGGQNNSASGDEENQGNSVSTNNEETHSISTDGDDTEIEDISDQEREEQEAFLSLAQVICDKLNSADLDGAIQNAVQNENSAGSEEQRREAFVDKLKTIVDDNRNDPTADSLRVVKLCGRIAKSVMRCDQYVEIFRNKGFKSSLSEASKTMSELESCMLFVGTDFGPKKTVRPLFSEIEKAWSEM